MKTLYVFALIGILGLGTAMADFVEPVKDVNQEVEKVETNLNPKGGFVGGLETIVTVKQVNEMRDDVPVVVQGHIVQRVGHEKYLFEDNTGSITVEIDDDEWRGQTITPTDIVKLYGDVDRGIFKTEIEIDRVEKL